MQRIVTMPSEEPSLDDLNFIMNLQRQEAFDDHTRNDASPLSDPPADNETPEEKLMKIVGSPLPGIPKDKQELIKRAQSARQKSARSRYSYSASGSKGAFNFDPSDGEKDEWRRTIDRSRSNEVQPADITEIRRVSSTASGNRSSARPPSTDKRRSMNRRRSSSRSLTGDLSVSSIRSSDTRNSEREGKSSNRRSSSRVRPNSEISVRSNRSLSSLERINNASGISDWDEGSKKDESSNVQSRYRRRSSSNPRNESSPMRRGRRTSTTPRQSESPTRRGRDSMKEQRSKVRMSSKDAEGRRRRRSNSRPKLSTETDDEPKFEQLWTPNSKRKSYEYGEKLLQEENNPVATGSFASVKEALTDDGKKKKTKLEKIHELNAKCERYKIEWINASKEKKKFRKELHSVQVDIVSLNMEIDTHKAEADILRRQLTESLQKLDETEQEKREELTQYANATKELAQSRIDYTKSLNDVRELRIEMDKLESTIREKDTHIDSLKDELGGCKKQVDELKLDLIHADDEAIKLDNEVKRIEEELVMFKAAAEQDAKEGGAENLRRVQSDIEHRLQDEKERRLFEKEEKLDAKIKQFEEERERFFQKQKEREEGLVERQHVETVKEKERYEQRRELDDTINTRLKELEANNTGLQGRLKSEQLDSTMKLKRRDESIEALQKNLAEVQKQLAARDADPDGVVSLQREVESAKAEIATMNEDLAEAQRFNGMLEEEIEDLRTGSSELRGELETLQKASTASTSEMNKLRRKVEEWQKKSSEWTDKGKLEETCCLLYNSIWGKFLICYVHFSFSLERESRILGKGCSGYRSLLQRRQYVTRKLKNRRSAGTIPSSRF